MARACACMYVSTNVYMYVCMYVCMHARTRAHTQKNVDVAPRPQPLRLVKRNYGGIVGGNRTVLVPFTSARKLSACVHVCVYV